MIRSGGGRGGVKERGYMYMERMEVAGIEPQVKTRTLKETYNLTEEKLADSYQLYDFLLRSSTVGAKF